MRTQDRPLEVTTIAFDLGNVLVRVNQPHLCQGLAEYTQASPEEIAALVLDGPLKYQYDQGRLTTQEFYYQIITGLQSSLSYDRFCELWTGTLTPWEGMAEVVAKLRQRYPLILVSNTDPLHFNYVWSQFPVLRHFSRYLLSYELGCQKPEPGFYQALLQAIAHPPEHCLVIDDLLPNVVAARQHGFQAWQFLSCKNLRHRLTDQGLW